MSKTFCSECENELDSEAKVLAEHCSVKGCKCLICSKCYNRYDEQSPRLNGGDLRCHNHRCTCQQCSIDFPSEIAVNISGQIFCPVCPAEVKAGWDDAKVLMQCQLCPALDIRGAEKIEGKDACHECSSIYHESYSGKEAALALA